MSFWFLIVFGLLFVFLEVFLGSFFLIFIGIAFLFTGFLDCIIGFESLIDTRGYIILAEGVFIGVLALFLILVFRKPLQKGIFKKSEFYKEDFLNSEGVGIVRGEMIEFKGTLWHCDDNRLLRDGERVKIKGIKDNRVILE